MFNIHCRALASLTLISALAAISSPAGAADAKPRLSLVGVQGDLAVGTLSEFQVMVHGAPPVAGVQLVIKYDPVQAKIVDADPKTAGSQAIPGTFFNAQKDFFTVRNDADAKTGELNYVASALYPAKESQGDGQILTFRITPYRPGDSVISIASARFGDYAGKPYDVVLDEPLTLHAVPGTSGFLAPVKTTVAAPVPLDPRGWLPMLAAGVTLLVVGGAAFWFGRRMRQGA